MSHDLYHLAESVWAEADGKVIRLDAVGVIYNALMAERERCAKIAEGCGERAIAFMNEKLGGYSNDFQRYYEGCISVATFIRDRPEDFESGANAAANSPALESAAATRIATTEIQND